MNVHVFAGPTIEHRAIRSELEADVSGPVAFGDVYLAAQRRPRAIVIIDGTFERHPAVWHKEIVWAMTEGIHVFGGASMGALRAAELSDFGMEGVGAIFSAFRSGALEDDDEVAVAHAQADEGYRPTSEAMVNMRATAQAAQAHGVLDAETSARFLTAAKARFYPDRSYAAAIADAKRDGARAQLTAFEQWLPLGRVDQKRLDALALLRRVAAWLSGAPGRKRVSYRFERTDAWEAAMRSLAGRVLTSTPGSSRSFADAVLLEDLKLRGRFGAIFAGAVVRGAAIAEAARAGVHPDPAVLRWAADEFRRERGLRAPEAFAAWRSAQDLSPDDLREFFEGEARMTWAAPALDVLGARELASHLRARGEYGALLSRAKEKADVLDARGLARPTLSDLGVGEDELWAWYFRDVAGEPTPSDVEAFARARGFADMAALRSAALRELAFRRWASGRAAG